MFKQDVINDLMAMGLSREEARLYLFLIGAKSGTVREIVESKLFKQRANIYKVLTILINKGYVMMEEKEDGKRFFPSSPDAIIMKTIQHQRSVLEDFEARANSISTAIEHEALSMIQGLSRESVRDQDPIDAITGFPTGIRDFIIFVVPEDWNVRETPYIGKKRGMGTIYSVEFYTKRRFGANDAGITVHDFPYTEHRDEAMAGLKSYHLAEMERGLCLMENQGPIRIRSYQFIPDMIGSLKYTRVETKLNMLGTFNGGLATFTIKRDPNRVYCIWGADLRDFEILATKILEKEASVVGL